MGSVRRGFLNLDGDDRPNLGPSVPPAGDYAVAVEAAGGHPLSLDGIARVLSATFGDVFDVVLTPKAFVVGHDSLLAEVVPSPMTPDDVVLLAGRIAELSGSEGPVVDVRYDGEAGHWRFNVILPPLSDSVPLVAARRFEHGLRTAERGNHNG